MITESIITTILVAVALVLAIATGILWWLNRRLQKNIDNKDSLVSTDLGTEELENNRQRYQQIFNTSLVAMSFYSKDGMLLDLNQKMRELCEFDEQGEKFFRNTCFFHLPGFDTDFDPENNDVFHVCQKMSYHEAGLVKYIEYKIRSIRDDQGQVVYHAFSARDITEEREMYLSQRQHVKELAKTNKQISRYEDELHYLLTNSKMFVWTSNIDTRTITFSTRLSEIDVSITFDDYIDTIWGDEKEASRKFMDNYADHHHNLSMIHHFSYTAISDEPGWYAIAGMPIHDKQGRFTGHFGVMRDITHLMEVQERLKRETQDAQDSGKKKSAFLANMTHEIRTPLNAIVGFSDLINTVETAEDRQEFVRIIRNNCDMLLRLINDILEVSDIKQAAQAISPEHIDFSQAFNDMCDTLAQRVEAPSVQFIAENPYESFHTCIDKGRMQQVITNFVTNAVKYTSEGHIKIGYRYQQDPKEGKRYGIYMYCEDTGTGIPKDKQDSIFERFVKLNDFVQGTGLGLSICQSIAERCNGQIGVNSEGLGHGSTFWIWIPCEQLTTYNN